MTSTPVSSRSSRRARLDERFAGFGSSARGDPHRRPGVDRIDDPEHEDAPDVVDDDDASGVASASGCHAEDRTWFGCAPAREKAVEQCVPFGQPCGMQRAADQRVEGVVIRPRTDDDLDACEAMARAVHQLDGYPRYPPVPDFGRFLTSPDAFGAWVATDGGSVVGHVALHRRATDEVMALAASATGVRVEELGVVARLLVAPSARRSGVGRSLLDYTEQDARARGLLPVLDVVVEYRAAIRSTRTRGGSDWVLSSSSPHDGTSFDEFVYLAPTRP